MNSICTASKSYRTLNSHLFQLWSSKYSSATASSQADVKIPNRIPRGPTDILKALEKTVSYDLTGPAYKYFDDPQLAPYTERHHRVYSLAKNAGRKAARWFKDEHPELFTQVISDPPIMSYMPPQPINENTVSEKLLFKKICDSQVTEAIKVYKVMKENNMDVTEETRQALLELLCFYNLEDPIPIEYPAERFYGAGEKNDSATCTWKDEPILKELFDSLEHLGSAPYSALLCGLYSYGAKSEGDELLQKMKEKKIKLTVQAYNAFFLRLISKFEPTDVKFQMIMDTLKEMSSEGVKPDISTLNAAIDVMSRIGIKDKFGIMLNLITEFRKIGIEPSLGTYSLFIRGFFGRDRANPIILRLLVPLMKTLKPEDIQLRQKADIHFFINIIRACVVFEKPELGIKSLELLLSSRNILLLDAQRSNIFFNNLFILLSQHSDFQTLVAFYRKLVPHVHTPSPQFYEMLFDACDLNSAVAELPGFWSDYVSTGALDNITVMKMLEVSVNLTGLPDEAVTAARSKIGELAAQLWTHKAAAQEERVYVKDPMTPEMCNLMISLLSRGCQWRLLQSCFKWMQEEGCPPEQEALEHVLDSCCLNNNPEVAVWALKFCKSSFGEMQLEHLASKLFQLDFLSPESRKDLKEVFDDSTSSSSSSSSSESESDSDADSSDSEDLSIPKKSQKDRNVTK